MNRPSERLQNTISIVVIMLLVIQTVLLIFVLRTLSSYNRLLLSSEGLAQAASEERLVGTQAPEFQLSDVEGSPRSLVEYKGRMVLLAFVSHSCPHCRELYPGLREYIRENPDVEVLLLAANSIDENIAFLNEFAYKDFENLHILAATQEVFKEYSITGTPTLVVVDEGGTIVNTGHAITAEQVSGLIRK